MAGFTPFQFSSRKLQYDTASSLTGKLLDLASLGTGIGGYVNKNILAWYEMWINPERVSLPQTYIQRPSHTAGSVVTFHYRRENIPMSVSGQCGWIRIRSSSEEAQEKLTTDILNARNPLKKGSETRDAYSKYGQSIKHGTSSPFKRSYEVSNTSNNSPRLFLQRLKAMADEPMYYVDEFGIEHYNVKYIKIYTKQFPSGMICEGYFVRFNIDESYDDGETIPYSFEFTVEDMKPVTLLQNVSGMFVGAAQGVKGLSI